MSHAPFVSALCSTTLVALSLVCAVAMADSHEDPAPAVAILALELDEALPTDVSRNCAKQLGPAVQADERKFRYIDPAKARDGLVKRSPALAGCFETACIKRAGTVLDASVGIRASVAGEAQIYDIKVKYYDLVTGKKLLEETKTCEICTALETGNLFAKTVQLGLRKVEVTPRKKAEPKVVTPTEKPAVSGDKVAVKVRILPEEGLIELGDLPLGTGAATTELMPGQYTLRGALEGYQTQEVPVSIEPKGSPLEIYVQLAPNPEVSESTGGGLQKSTGRLVAGWILAVVGAGGAGAGGYLLWLDGQVTCATGTFSECPNVFETTTPGILAFGAGMVALTSGIFLIALDATAEEAPAGPPAAGFDLGLDPTTGAGVVQFNTSF
jgi:hypothetical protein